MSTSRFDAAASQWDANPFVVTAATQAAAIVEAQIKKLATAPKTTLEFGCGTGLLAFMLADHFESVTGVDVSQGMVDQFNKKAADRHVAAKVRAECANLTTAGQLNNKYDVIFSNLAFHHVENIAQMCTLLASHLNPGGVLIAVDFSKTDYSVLFHPPEMAEGVYHHGIDVKDLGYWAKSTGEFSSVEVLHPAFHLEKPTLEGLKSFPFLALVATKL